MNHAEPSAPTLTTSQLRNRAEEIVAAYDRHNEILAAADAQDLADETKLQALRDKLRGHEQACDKDKLEDFQTAAALKAQLAALETKVAADKVSRRDAAKTKAREAVRHLDLPLYFHAALLAERAAVLAHLLPHSETEGRALGLSAHVDSINSLDCWARELVYKIPGHIVAQRLKAFANGERPIWRI